MSSAYPSEGQQGGYGNAAFYPHSVNVLSGGSMGVVPVSTETRTATISSSAANVLSTPNRTPVMPFGFDHRAKQSPYREVARSDVSKSPYQQPMQQPSSVDGPRVEMEGGQRVVYSSQPMTSEEYAAFMSGSSNPSGPVGNYFPAAAPQQQSYTSAQPQYMPASSFSPPYGGGFNGSFSTSMQPLAPNGIMPAGMSMANAQVGISPRSYQEQMNTMMNASSTVPAGADGTMMMFAEQFRNQCIALSQYYAANPDAVVSPVKPKQQADIAYVEPAPAPALMRPPFPTMGEYDHENYDTANATPREQFFQKSEPALQHFGDDSPAHSLPRESPKAAPKGCMCFGLDY
jgi:hypothetical protein